MFRVTSGLTVYSIFYQSSYLPIEVQTDETVYTSLLFIHRFVMRVLTIVWNGYLDSLIVNIVVCSERNSADNAVLLCNVEVIVHLI